MPRPVCCHPNGGAGTSAAAKRRRDRPPSFWRNEYIRFFEQNQRPRRRPPRRVERSATSRPPAPPARHLIIPCSGETFPVQATKIRCFALCRESTASASNLLTIRRPPVPEPAPAARNPQ